MLLDKHYDLAQAIVTRLASEGTVIKVKPSTPLSLLMAESYDEQFGDTSGSNDVVGVNRHDQLMDGAVKLGVETIQASVYRARNVVRPMVTEIHEDLQKEVETRAVDSMEYTIVTQNLPKAYDVPALFELVSAFSAMLPGDAVLPKDLRPTLDPEELAKLTRLNITTIDNAMSEIYTAKPGLQAEIALDLFTNSSWRWIDSDESVLVAYVIARGLLTNLDEWDESGSVGLKGYLAGLVAIFAKRIHIRMTKRDAARSAKAIIVQHDGKIIYVNGDTYKDWLLAGGAPEVIIGAVVSKVRAASAAMLDVNREQYIKAYTSYTSISAGAVANVKREITIRLIRERLFEIVRTDEVFKENDGYYFERLTKELRSTHLDTTDPYPYILSVVCNTFYEDTDALRILTTIDQLTKADPTLDPRQAATVAYHGMVVDWLLSQLNLTNK